MISVVIPTFNSSKYVAECLKSISKSKLIDEIVISDDNSVKEDLFNLQKIVRTSSINGKIKLLTNESNRGAYINKFEAVKNTTNDIVYLLDSDNIARFNIDKTLSQIINQNNKYRLYLPSKIYHFYNSVNKLTPLYKTIIGNLEIFTKNNLEITKEEIKQIFEGNINFMYHKNKSIYWVLNIGNFIFHKDMFLKFMKNNENLSRQDLSLDAVAFSYYWLKNDNSIFLLEDFYHFHRKRYDSVSWTEKDNAQSSRKKFNSLFLNINKN